MNLPGFTGEASLYQTTRPYRPKFTSTLKADANTLQPAEPVYVHYPCWLHCQECSPSNITACMRCSACRRKGSGVRFGY